MIFRYTEVKDLDEIKRQLETPSFRRKAKFAWWVKYFAFFLVTLPSLCVFISPYIILSRSYNHIALVVIPPLAFVLALFVGFKVSDPYKCTACGRGSVRAVNPPFYCRSCGMTFLFHRLGKWHYKKGL